jgi:hypothetical protein
MIIQNLRELDDPTFLAHWAAARNQLALTRASSPEFPEIKRRYEAMADEFRRRIDAEPNGGRQRLE